MNDMTEVKNKLSEFLQLSTMSLATVGKSGQSHSVPVYFVADEHVNLYFYSKAESQHIVAIQSNPKSSAAIYPDSFDWKEIRGLQLRGIVKKVDSKRKAIKGFELFVKKFPFSSELLSEFYKNDLYVFVPGWVRIIDNRVSFGFKEEISIHDR